METTSTTKPFTVLSHDKFFGPAALSLRPNAFRLLVHFERLWARETRNYTRPACPIPFTHTTCPFDLQKAAFRDARSELVHAGFIVTMNQNKGLFAACDVWATTRRVVAPPGPPPKRQSVATPGVENRPATGAKIAPEGVENRPATRAEIAPLFNKYNTNTTTTNQPKGTLKAKEGRGQNSRLGGGGRFQNG